MNTTLNSRRMIDVFDLENIIYAQQEEIDKTMVEEIIKSFLLSIGLPRQFKLIKFFTKLSLLSQDDKFCIENNGSDGMYVFGLKLYSPYVITECMFEKAGLVSNPTIQDILEKTSDLDSKDTSTSYLIDEINYSHRICLDTKNNNQIISIRPDDKKKIFFNSSIQQLVLSMIAYEECISTKEFISNMQIIDPITMENDESWWNQLTLELDEYFLM
jgi:hypothetical protein